MKAGFGALDGGIRDGENEIQVILIHQKDKLKMDNFVPGNYANDLSDKAFKDHLGEFTINAFTQAVSALQLSFEEGILIHYLLSQMRKVARIFLPRAV